ncbi:MAG: 4-hydroxy-3-methylbut-2-enyl diphosphate reductase, partial [Spirochaetaceae bacterium]
MKVIVPGLSGFCPGVKIAEKKLFEMKKSHSDESLYIYGNVINNRKYIEYLEQNNIHTTGDMHSIPPDAVIAIRTHGLSRIEEAGLRSLHRVADLTCTHVKFSQKKILEYSEKGYFIVIVGKKDHPETRGLESYAKQKTIVENDDDIKVLLAGMPSVLKASAGKVFVIPQTTASRGLFLKTKAALTDAFTDTIIESYDSICPVTEKKEKEALKLQKDVDVSFVVGDRISANANKLFQILLTGNRETYFIEDLDDLVAMGLPLESFRKALVVSSASTPRFIE